MRKSYYLLATDRNIISPFGDKNLPPAIWALDRDGDRSFNILAMLELPATHFLLGFIISADQRRAMIVTAQNNYPDDGQYYPDKWLLIYLSQHSVTIEAQGNAVGFHPSGLSIGNRSKDQGFSYRAVSLENDYRHVWSVYSGGSSEVVYYAVKSTGVEEVFVSHMASSLTTPTCIADKGMCWTAYNYFTDVFTRHTLADPQDMLLAEIVQQVCQRVGLTADIVDTSRLTASVTGFTITQSSTARTVLDTLMQAYFFNAVEVNGILRFIPMMAAYRIAYLCLVLIFYFTDKSVNFINKFSNN